VFLEFGHLATLNFLEKMNMFGSYNSTEEGQYDKEMDSGGPDWTTMDTFQILT
jgi:hypothetical protein